MQADELLIKLDLEMPEDRVFFEELDLIQAHFSGLMRQTLAEKMVIDNGKE